MAVGDDGVCVVRVMVMVGDDGDDGDDDGADGDDDRPDGVDASVTVRCDGDDNDDGECW